MGRRHRDAGSRGEVLAAVFLTARGCRVVATNLRVGADEIDLVALDGDRRAAVEVKYTTRRGTDPLAAVDSSKLDRVRRASSQTRFGIGRVDLVGINDCDGMVEIRWLVGVA